MSLAPIHRYIGRIIHLIRKEKGMRQSELASLTGLKQPNLSRIENGLVSPRQNTLKKLLERSAWRSAFFTVRAKFRKLSANGRRRWGRSTRL